MLACGVDVGSVQTKAVIIDGNYIVQGRGVVHSGANLARAARHALQEALLEAEVAEYDLTYIMGTGYGRLVIPFAHSSMSEPACSAKGAIYRFPKTRTILDIGGQDTTAVKIDSYGNVLDFAMNDKCASGTGRFIESVGGLLGLSIQQISDCEMKGSDSIHFTEVCTVYAESEIISYLEHGCAVEDILAGVYDGLANRMVGLLERVGIEEEITLTGGVSGNRAMVRAVETKLGRSVNSGVDGVYVVALGAAILGLERATVGI
jgi:(R)-2-hydroxyacyl-CoA dehydratese activating ATPase